MKEPSRYPPTRLAHLLFLSVLLIGTAFSGCGSRLSSAGATESPVFVGTYTRQEGHVDGKADGIYRLLVDRATGAIGEPELVAETVNPSFLTVHPRGELVYAVSELAREGEPTGFLHSFRLRNGQLTEIGKVPTDGKAPCHVMLDPTNRFLSVTNYVGGVAKLYAIGADGAARPVDKFTVPESARNGRSSWLHSTTFSPAVNLAVIADKGLDKLWLFELDRENGRYRPHPQIAVDLNQGAGPRHSVWSKDGSRLYVINELGNTVDVLRYDATARQLVREQTISTLPENHAGQSFCADIHLTADGRFLYGSNRGHNSIVMYDVHPESGRLSLIGFEPTRGEFPRNFTISPDDRHLFVANQNTSNVTVYDIDGKTGALRYTERNYAIPTPVCLAWE